MDLRQNLHHHHPDAVLCKLCTRWHQLCWALCMHRNPNSWLTAPNTAHASPRSARGNCKFIKDAVPAEEDGENAQITAFRHCSDRDRPALRDLTTFSFLCRRSASLSSLAALSFSAPLTPRVSAIRCLDRQGEELRCECLECGFYSDAGIELHTT